MEKKYISIKGIWVKFTEAWKDQNFWINLVLMAGGFWAGFSEIEATSLVGAVFVAIGAVGSLSNFFKNADFDWLRWIKNANFWNYLAVILTMLVPEIPSEIIGSVEEIVRSLLDQNYQALIAALFTLATFLYKVFKKDPGEGDKEVPGEIAI